MVHSGQPSPTTAVLGYSVFTDRYILIEDLVPITALQIGFINAIIAAGQLLNEKFYSKQADIMTVLDYRKNTETCVPFDAIWWRTLELETLFGHKFSIIT